MSVCCEELVENFCFFYVVFICVCSCCYLVWGVVNEVVTSLLVWLLYCFEILVDEDLLVVFGQVLFDREC